jgi:hypothetical protein
MAAIGKEISLALTAAALGLSLFAASPARSAQPEAPPVLDVRNIADDFLTFWDATRSMPTTERVAIFKRDVAPKFPGFYGVARFNGLMTEAMRDGTIAKSIEEFGAIHDAYASKLSSFGKDLGRNTAVFIKAFPDFRPTSPVWVVHSLGEFDGGTREFDGESLLIFGIDGMVNFHTKDVVDESAFFHHELFHVYHQPRFGECDLIWCSLWREGLATYVASKLDPDANEAELLLTTPQNMAEATRAKLLPALVDLRNSLTNKDRATYADLFGFGGTPKSDLPQRRGYFLGFLVARELGQTHSLKTLANMPAAKVQPLVAEGVDRLIAKARASR